MVMGKYGVSRRSARLILGIVILTAVLPAFAEEVILYREDFNTKDALSGWSIKTDGGEAVIVETPGVAAAPEQPNRCLKLSDETYASKTIVPPLRARVVVEFDTMITGTPGHGAAILYLNQAVCLSFMGGELIYWDGGTSRSAGPYRANDWYHIKYLVDPETQTFALFVNDKPVGHGIRFRNNATELSTALCATHTHDFLYLDNLVFRTFNEKDEAAWKQGVETAKARLKNRTTYCWFPVDDLEVPDHWHLDAWYRQAAAPGVTYAHSGMPDPAQGEVAPGHVILIQSDADEVVRFAADELQKYLFQITGRRFPMVWDKAPESAGIVLEVGLHLSELLAGREEDDYVLCAKGAHVTLTGTTGRSTLYSVYAFLERYLDCRWYHADPTDEVIPRMSLEAVDAVLRHPFSHLESPVMPYRALMILSTCDVAGAVSVKPKNETGVTRRWFAAHLRSIANLIDWMAKNRYNTALLEGSWHGQFILRDNWDLVKTLTPEIRKRGLHYGLGGHFWGPFVCQDTPGWPQDHAWGPFRDGTRLPIDILINRCFCTTNHEAVRTFLSEIVSFYRANPEFDLWAVWSPDGTDNTCECEICGLFSVQERLIRMQNIIKRALDKETLRPQSIRHGDTISNSLLVYANTSRPPENEVKLDDGTLVSMDIYAVFSRPFEPNAIVDQWRNYLTSACGKPRWVLFGRWTRLFYTGYHLLPPASLEATMKELVAQGFVGIENFHGMGAWWLKGPVQYLTGKLMWDPDSLTLTGMKDDYFAHYFGGTAKPIRLFYEKNEELHTVSEFNYVYGNNWDIFWPGQAHSCYPIEPQTDRDLRGFVEYLDAVLSLSESAKSWFEEARTLVQSDPQKDMILARIGKVQDSWVYYQHQKSSQRLLLEGLRFLEQAWAAVPGTDEYDRLVDQAEARFRSAGDCWSRNLDLIRANTVFEGNGRDTGVLWDGGLTRGCTSHDKWLDIVDRMRTRTSNDTQRLWKLHYPGPPGKGKTGK